MKISKKQLIMLYQVLIDSFSITGSASPFKFSKTDRMKLGDEILNQQSKDLKEIE
jgi:hypothetical protein